MIQFRHEAFFYSDAAAFLKRTVPFIRDGLAAGEPVLVVETREKIDLLRRVLARDSESIEFADISLVGANPARIIPAWRDFVDKHADSGSRMRGIGEPRSRRRCQRAAAVRAHRAIRPQERPLREQGQRGSGPHRDEGAQRQGAQQRPLTEPPSRAGR